MALNETILEKIVSDIAVAMATVTTANGYQVDVEDVHRPKTIGGINRTPPASVTYSVQVLIGDAVPDPTFAYNNNPPRVAWMQEVSLDLVYRPSDTATDPLDQILGAFAADVTKALFVDETWSGNAQGGTFVQSIEVFQGSGFVGTTLTAIVKYRHKQDDPYTL